MNCKEYIEKMAKQNGLSLKDYVKACEDNFKYEEDNKTEEDKIREGCKKTLERYKSYVEG